MQIKKLFIALGIVLPLHMQGQNFLIKDAPEVIESYVNQLNCINKISLTVVHLIF